MEDIISKESPLISNRLYQDLIKAYPPLTVNDVNKDTSIIEIQRRYAQQEVVEYIGRFVKDFNIPEPKPTFWSKIKLKLNRR